MKLTITRIEEHVVTCEFENGSLIDVARIWLNPNIKVGDEIEVDVSNGVESIKNMNERLKIYESLNK